MKKTLPVIIIMLVLAALLSACSGGSNRLAATSWPGVSVSEDAIFVAFGNRVYALDPVTGIERWKFPNEPGKTQSFFSAPILVEDDSQLIIGGYDNILYSVDPATGNQNTWSFAGATNRYIGDPLTTARAIFAPSADGNLYALDTNGQSLWAAPFHSDDPFWSQPVLSGDMLYQAGLDHSLYAINATTGAERWATDLGAPIASSPALADGILYAGTFGSEVVALDADTGEVLWRTATDDWVWGGPVVSAGIVYIGDINGTLYALDADGGDERWRFKSDGGIYSAPLVIDGVIFFGTDTGHFYAIGADNSVAWTFAFTGRIFTTPDLSGELLIIATIEGDRLLTALDLEGSPRWTYTPADQSTPTPTD